MKDTRLVAFGGLDLSKRTDFSAYTLYIDVQDEKHPKRRYALHKFYIPKEQIKRKMQTDTYLIEKWVKDGFITATPGEVIDLSFIYEDIVASCKKFRVEQVRYDRNLAEFLIQPLLDANVPMLDFPQSMLAMSEPAKAWEVAVRRGLVIDCNPVMEWMVSCASVYQDANDNIKVVKPDAQKSSKRIDGVITSIMANSGLEAYYIEQEYQKTVSLDDIV